MTVTQSEFCAFASVSQAIGDYCAGTIGARELLNALVERGAIHSVSTDVVMRVFVSIAGTDEYTIAFPETPVVRSYDSARIAEMVVGLESKEECVNGLSRQDMYLEATRLLFVLYHGTRRSRTRFRADNGDA